MRRGVFQVMEGRRVFEDLTVDENIVMGATRGAIRAGLRRDHELVFELFPRLRERRRELAGYLSGGEQQMLAISRALGEAPAAHPPRRAVARPRPLLVREIFEIVSGINREEGTTMLLVEQNANLALGIAHYGYIMEGGRIVLDGEPEKPARTRT